MPEGYPAGVAQPLFMSSRWNSRCGLFMGIRQGPCALRSFSEVREDLSCEVHRGAVSRVHAGNAARDVGAALGLGVGFVRHHLGDLEMQRGVVRRVRHRSTELPYVSLDVIRDVILDEHE